MRASEETIARAQRMLHEINEEHGYTTRHMPERDTRYIGWLGEIAFDRWLCAMDIDHRWLVEQPTGNPDFRIGQAAIDIKTARKPASVMRDLETLFRCVMIPEHANKPEISHFFFEAYTDHPPTVWMIGGMAADLFRRRARIYQTGETIAPGFAARWPTMAVTVDLLTPPLDFVRSF